MSRDDAGGAEIERECRRHVESEGEVKEGKVFVSTSGKLICQNVIHAVGPKWQDGYSKEDDKLYDAVYESLTAAEELGLSSVAFPAVSCGRSKYPLDRATKTIIKAVKDFLEEDSTKHVRKVSMVCRSDKVVKAFKSSLDDVCGSSSGQDSSTKTGI